MWFTHEKIGFDDGSPNIINPAVMIGSPHNSHNCKTKLVPDAQSNPSKKGGFPFMSSNGDHRLTV